jgi:hypothetical protein
MLAYRQNMTCRENQIPVLPQDFDLLAHKAEA